VLQRHTILGICIFLTIIFIDPVEANDNYPWTLKNVHQDDARTILVTDINHDKIDDIVVCRGPYVYLRNQQGINYDQDNFDTEIFFPVSIAIPDGYVFFDKIVFSIRYSDTVFLHTYIYPDSAIQRHKLYVGEDISPKGEEGYDSAVRFATAEDINKDGFLDLLCCVSTGFDLHPRGILAYDLQNDKELWHHWVGAAPDDKHVCVADVDSDGENEIIFGTQALYNGACVNDVDDNHSWVIALDNKGNTLWRRRIGGQSTVAYIWVGDLYDSGEFVVVVCEGGGLADEKEPGKLMILDARTGKTIKSIEPSGLLLSLQVGDLDNDAPEIITSDAAGWVHIFEPSLTLKDSVHFDVHVRVWGIEDIDLNGTKEVLLTTNDRRIVILDKNLKILCNYETSETGDVTCYLARNKNERNIITCYNKDCYKVLRVVGAKTTTLPLPLNTLVVIFFGAVLLFILTFVLINKIKPSERPKSLYTQAATETAGEKYEDMVILTNVDKRGDILNHTSRRPINKDDLDSLEKAKKNYLIWMDYVTSRVFIRGVSFKKKVQEKDARANGTKEVTQVGRKYRRLIEYIIIKYGGRFEYKEIYEKYEGPGSHYTTNERDKLKIITHGLRAYSVGALDSYIKIIDWEQIVEFNIKGERVCVVYKY